MSYYRVIHGHNPQRQDELHLVVGDVVTHVKDLNNGWTLGRNISSPNGSQLVGVFPSSCVAPMARHASVTSDCEPRHGLMNVDVEARHGSITGDIENQSDVVNHVYCTCGEVKNKPGCVEVFVDEGPTCTTRFTNAEQHVTFQNTGASTATENDNDDNGNDTTGNGNRLNHHVVSTGSRLSNRIEKRGDKARRVKLNLTSKSCPNLKVVLLNSDNVTRDDDVGDAMSGLRGWSKGEEVNDVIQRGPDVDNEYCSMQTTNHGYQFVTQTTNPTNQSTIQTINHLRQFQSRKYGQNDIVIANKAIARPMSRQGQHVESQGQSTTDCRGQSLGRQGQMMTEYKGQSSAGQGQKARLVVTALQRQNKTVSVIHSDNQMTSGGGLKRDNKMTSGPTRSDSKLVHSLALDNNQMVPGLQRDIIANKHIVHSSAGPPIDSARRTDHVIESPPPLPPATTSKPMLSSRHYKVADSQRQVILAREPTSDKKMTRWMLSLVVGLVVGVSLHLYTTYHLDYEPMVAAGFAASATVLVALASGLSRRVRCTGLLILPTLTVTGRGRTGFLLLISGLLLGGPVTNVCSNVKEMSRSMSCSAEQSYNQSMFLQNPFDALTSQLNTTMSLLNDALNTAARDLRPLQEGLQQLNQGVFNGIMQLFGAHKVRTVVAILISYCSY